MQSAPISSTGYASTMSNMLLYDNQKSIQINWRVCINPKSEKSVLFWRISASFLVILPSARPPRNLKMANFYPKDCSSSFGNSTNIELCTPLIYISFDSLHNYNLLVLFLLTGQVLPFWCIIAVNIELLPISSFFLFFDLSVGVNNTSSLLSQQTFYIRRMPIRRKACQCTFVWLDFEYL